MKSRFRLPGPTPLPPEVYEAMQRPMIPHRSAQFSTFYTDLLARLRLLHCTDGAVLTWSASGSAAWEIGLVNLLEPGDAVLSVSCGDFGDRFRAVSRRLGFDVRELDVPWGEAVSPLALSAALEANPDVGAVLLTHNETSTGVTNPLRDLAAVARDAGALTLVDAVSSAAGLPLEVDAWDLDFVFSGSQKAWMCPPGVAIVAIGPRAMERSKVNTGLPRAFFDIESALAAARKGQTPATPALSTHYALEAAVGMIEREGLTTVWKRHALVGQRLRTGLASIGLQLLPAEAVASNTVTAFWPPEGLSAVDIVRQLQERFGITATGGQGKMATDIVRIGHMGWVDEEDIDLCLEALQTIVSGQHSAA